MLDDVKSEMDSEQMECDKAVQTVGTEKAHKSIQVDNITAESTEEQSSAEQAKRRTNQFKLTTSQQKPPKNTAQLNGRSPTSSKLYNTEETSDTPLSCRGWVSPHTGDKAMV